MTHKSSDDTFGLVLSRYFQRDPALTRDRMAQGIQQDPAVITDMCKGRRLNGPRARERVLAIIGWLYEHQALLSVDEADELLRAAHMPELSLDQAGEAELFQLLDDPELSMTTDQIAPFSMSRPITHPGRFFGRQYELSRLFGLWRSSLQNAVILGPRYSGKTSLLHYIQRITRAAPDRLRPAQRADWLPHPERYTWVFVDFLNPNMGRRDYLLRYLSRRMGLPALKRYDLDHFLETVQDHLRRPTVVLFDEVGVVLQRYSDLDKSFWDGLRSLATTPARNYLAFVLTAAEYPQQLARNNGYDSDFFNITGYVARLGPLTEPEAYDLVASSPLPFSADDADWIVQTSRRWPLLLQVLCHERLSALVQGETGAAWRANGLGQIELHRALLEVE